MLKPYRTIQDVLASPWAQRPLSAKTARDQTDHVLRSTKLESSIYHDLRRDDPCMDAIEQSAAEKLKSFPALSQDVFQSFYSLAIPWLSVLEHSVLLLLKHQLLDFSLLFSLLSCILFSSLD